MGEIYSLQGKRVLVAGHTGMAGSSIVRRLAREDCEVLTISYPDLDMTRQKETEDYLAAARPDAMFVAAAKVGGIYANSTYPADFLYQNLAIETNLIHAAKTVGVGKLLFLGSSCIYPREAPQPMKEEALLTGPLEPTNEGYAIAKIAGIKMCDYYRRQYGCDFISAMPTNLYGPGDRYDLQNGHVVAAMIMKVHAAKTNGDATMTIWGSGTPKREFLFTEDLADGLVFLMKNYSGIGHVNLGTGRETTIRELAESVAKVAGWSGSFTYDRSKPDGMMRKVMDVSRMTQLGWAAGTGLEAGLKVAYDWYVSNRDKPLAAAK
jgi:GDP-L-fucose synthase